MTVNANRIFPEVSPEVEARIRADERFRMALFAADGAQQIQDAYEDSPKKQLVFDVLKAHSADVMLKGQEYSDSVSALPPDIYKEFEARKLVIEAASTLFSDMAVTAPNYDARDLEQPGSFIQYEIDLIGTKDDEGNEGGGLLN